MFSTTSVSSLSGSNKRNQSTAGEKAQSAAFPKYVHGVKTVLLSFHGDGDRQAQCEELMVQEGLSCDEYARLRHHILDGVLRLAPLPLRPFVPQERQQCGYEKLFGGNQEPS